MILGVDLRPERACLILNVIQCFIRREFQPKTATEAKAERATPGRAVPGRFCRKLASNGRTRSMRMDIRQELEGDKAMEPGVHRLIEHPMPLLPSFSTTW